MHWVAWLILAGVLWLAWAFFSRRVMENPRGDVFTGLAYRAALFYVKAVQRLRGQGLEHVPRGRDAGPLLVVCNHTSGVDPVLVQALCPFYIRWMMAKDMQWSVLDSVWEYFDLIDVERKKADTRALREAIRAVRGGDVIGIFPEGRIEKPRGVIQPFHPGVGMIASSSGAPVLPVFISGTAEAPTAWASLWHPGRARVLFGPVMRWPEQTEAASITADIERWFRKMAVRRAG